MKLSLTILLGWMIVIGSLPAGSVSAQAKPEAKAPEVSEEDEKAAREAGRMEAELGKYKDTTPEAAELMVKLVEFYHVKGQVFGLTRIGQRFVAIHTNEPRHQAVMLKLIDGLEAAARNKEFIATVRQFLQRYPDSPAVPGLEIRLTTTLEELMDYDGAGDAHRVVWRRQGATEVGMHHALRAVMLYSLVNSKDVFTKAADLAYELVEKLPDGPLAREMVYQSMIQYQRGSEWAKANRTGAMALQRGIQVTPERRRWLHFSMGENFGRQAQWANAVDSFRKARADKDGQDVHQALLQAIANDANSTPNDLAPLVQEFLQKYPDRRERFAMESLLAYKHRAAMQRPQAQAVFARLLEYDAHTGNHTVYYLEQTPNEPADNAAAEQVLLGAIAKNPLPYDKAVLRYYLALTLYRDRLKDINKMKPVLRDLISQSSTGDHFTQSSMDVLLTNASSDAEFQQDVALIIESMKKNVHQPAWRGYLTPWAKTFGKDEKVKARADFALAQADKWESDPLFKTYAASEAWTAESQAARDQLIKTGKVAELGDPAAGLLLYRNAYHLRHYGPAERRAESATAYGSLVKRFPKDYDYAYDFLTSSTDYGPKEVAKEALTHFLTFEPKNNVHETFRRIFLAADMNADAALARQSLAWMQKAEKTFGPAMGYAYSVGDTLTKLGLKAEAEEVWRSHLAVDPNSSDTYNCSDRLLALLPADSPDRETFLQARFAVDSDYHGYYAAQLADIAFKANDLKKFEQILTATRDRQKQRPGRIWGMSEYPARTWVDGVRADVMATPEKKRTVFTLIKDLPLGRPSAMATLALWEAFPETVPQKPMDRLLQIAAVPRMVDNSTTDWDALMPYVQSALTKKDYLLAATLAGSMLSDIPNLDPPRQQAGRAIVAQSYSRLGAVGLTIDERSELAPLMQAALYLRLGDRTMALESYTANKTLFNTHRDEVPFDLLLFVCESLMAVGGDENHEYVEEVLRGWLVKNSENAQFDATMKASVQLMLAKNFDRARRYDIARSEYATILNRYPDTPQAIEAEFGIGEAYMAQKVYDQAEAVFEKLAVSRNVEIVVRAEFLRGVLAYRRGDKDEARGIFKSVLDRVPNIELANQALFNLAEVYKDEERFIDQLNLLRTVGRLGRKSKRTHAPGVALSIVVQDSDLGISRGHSRIPVIVTTQPGGDQERVFLTSGGAGKGLFRADLETRLGQVTKGDGILQVTGKDMVLCDYPEEFKQEFKSVPLSDVEIRIASDGRLRMSSSKIIDEKEESFSQRLERETREKQQDLRVSQARPYFQIKPGNQIYMRVDDADRDFSDAVDEVVVKLTAESGDTVQVNLKETGSHTGVFEGKAPTAELPAGALAKDMALEHPPVLAIDQDPDSYWMSEPDGATPKWLSVDMKDLKSVSRVRIASPQKDRNIPVRGELLGSYDGQFWFRIASQPAQPPAPPTQEKFGRMKHRVYAGNYTGLTTWNQILDISKAKPVEEKEVDTLAWQMPADAENAAAPHAVLWEGKIVQDRPGATRIFVNGQCTALWIDGRLELPVGATGRSVDLWLERGTHDLTIFSATANGTQGVAALIARADTNAATVTMYPFRASDFDLDDAALKPARVPEPARGDFARGEWTFAFEPRELRHVKFVVQEYVGEAIAIGMFEVAGEDAGEIFIPTKDDVLTLSTNQTLEIAGGDVITGAYTDEVTHQDRDGSRLLTEKLTATYFNASIQAIQYEFLRNRAGNVQEIPKQVMRINPGDRFIVEITDYDLDQSAEQDTVKFDIIVNDGPPVEFVATETESYTGKFRKEIDTSATEEDDKVKIAPGDRIYVRYIDSQNTFPGHAVPREAVIYANSPSAGRVRILETRVVPGNKQQGVPPQYIYHTPPRTQKTSHVAFEAPLTVEVIDPDAARDSRSEVIVKLTTPAGSQVDVRCVVSGAFEQAAQGLPFGLSDSLALEEGRFIGQVIMQLGGKNSPQEVPVTSEMPRDLIGGTVSESGKGGANDVSLVTRVLNLTGQDTILAEYEDAMTLKNNPPKLKTQARLISNGKLRSTDRDYDKDVADLHVGEKLFLIVTDPDQDRTDERDSVKLEIATSFGDKETVELHETLAHSGVFTGSVTLKSSEEPKPGNFDPDDPAIECYFGDMLTMTYHDPAASTEQGTLDSIVEAPVVIGTDGLVAAFTKTFNNEKLAVETKFTIAESYFELFKSHKQLGRSSEQKADLEAGRRVLREVMEDYPDPKYVPRIAYLLGQFSQELEDWDEAVSAYRMIIDQYPDHTLAPDAQYKMAQAYEERGDFDDALEAYVTLAATYPKSPLIASVMIRICDHFYKAEEFRIAAQVGEKFIEKFEGHQHASRIAFRIGQCFYKAEEFVQAGKAFDRFAKEFPDDTLTPDSLFWAGESYRKGSSVSEAFRRYNRCRWDFPASEAAKFARGRLALPEMLQQFESEANAIENQ